MELQVGKDILLFVISFQQYI